MIEKYKNYNSIINNISKLIFSSCKIKNKIFTSLAYIKYLSSFIYHRLLLISNAAYETNLIFGQKMNFIYFNLSIIDNLITYLSNNNDIGFYYFLKCYEQQLKCNFISKIIKVKLLYDFLY